MIESSHITQDSFTTNSGQNDASKNIATFIAAPSTETAGGSLNSSSFVTHSKLDLTLSEYLSRPKLMYSGTLTTYSTAPDMFDFAYDYLSAADIIAKTRYVHLLRGTFQVKLIVTAAPYATGRIGLATMYGAPTAYGAGIISTDINIFNMASKTHVTLDLGSANTCMLSIPLHIKTPYVRNEAVDAPALRQMKLIMFSLSHLLNSQTNTVVDVAYKIYVSLVDAETSIPVPIAPSYPAGFSFIEKSNGNYMSSITQIDDSDIIEQTSEKKEASNHPISAPASIISDAAGKLADTPVIGPFAMATSIGAGAIGQIARLFGFSRPRDFSKPCYPHAPNLSSSVGEVRAKQVTADPNQEVTVDSSFLGENGDSLAYENTIQRWGFASRFSWTQQQTVGTTIYPLPVTPRFCSQIGSGGVTYVAPTPLAYCSSLFTAWRGSIKYKISIPANRFVRGKLRVYWAPSWANPSLDVISNNALSILLDLTQTVEVELTVPYMSDNLYKAMGPYVGSTNAAQDQNINGYLFFVVEEPLIANNTTWYAEILIYTAAGTDFELAIPGNQQIINQIFDLFNPAHYGQNLTPYNEVLNISNNTAVTNSDWYTKTSLSNSVNPAMEERISLLPDNTEEASPGLIHIGESIPSLRTVLKRFHPLYNIPNWTVPAPRQQCLWFIPYFPPPQCIQYVSATDYSKSPYITTPASFLSRMFAGVRGTMRYAFLGGNASAPTYVGRCFEQDLKVRYFGASLDNRAYTAFNQYILGGVNTYYNAYEPLVVDVPFQNYRWFYPTEKREFNNAPSVYGITFSQFVNDSSIRENLVMQSTGEDFQFVIYNGPPIVAMVQFTT